MLRVIYEQLNKAIIFGIAVLFISFAFIPAASAVTLIPPSLEIGLTPGQTTETKIKLYNETQNTIQLYTETRSFVAKGETGQPDFDFESEPIGLGNWIEVEAGPIVLKSGERYEIPVKINTPVDADPGGHYASLFFSSSPQDATGAGTVSIASKLGTLILGRVAGDVIEDGTITEFGLTGGKTTLNRLPVDFFTRFQNTGNVHLRPEGDIAIDSMFGKQVDTLEVNASKGATLPKSIRRYEVTWEKGQVKSSSGNFFTKFFDEYANERNNFGFGKYTANLSVHAGTNSIDDSATTTFWVIPWHIIVVWGIVAILVIVILIFMIKRYNTWILKKAGNKK